MTPGVLFRIALRILGFWTIVTTLAEAGWNLSRHYPSRTDSIRLLAAFGVAVLELAIGILLVTRAARISARFHFEPHELRQSGEIRLDGQHVLQVGLQVLGITLLLQSLSPWVSTLLWLSDAVSPWHVFREALRTGIYFIGGAVLLVNARSIAGRCERPSAD